MDSSRIWQEQFIHLALWPAGQDTDQGGLHLAQDKERPSRQDLPGHLLGHRGARFFVGTSIMAVGKFVQEDTAGSDGLGRH